MNGRERIQAALELKQPDRVPIWEMAYNESSIIGIARYFVDADELPEPKLIMDMKDTERAQVLRALMAFVRELDLDGVTAVSLAPRQRVDKQHIRDAIGVVYHLSDFGEPYPVDGPIQERSDWFEHWATEGVKPLFLCEYGVPWGMNWTLYRGWYKGQRDFGSAALPCALQAKSQPELGFR